MIYRRTVGFKREFDSLPPEIRRIALAKFSLFSNNWRHPSLHVHKLQGTLWHGRQVFDLYLNDNTACSLFWIMMSWFLSPSDRTASSQSKQFGLSRLDPQVSQ